MDMDLTKTMIQQSLWEMYKATGKIEYRTLYEIWYDCYEKINISGLSVNSENKKILCLENLYEGKNMIFESGKLYPVINISPDKMSILIQQDNGQEIWFGKGNKYFKI